MKIAGWIILSCLCLHQGIGQTTLNRQWLMAFHVCGSTCNGFQDHQVYLAESDDLNTWSLVSGFIPYSGSVPDIITRQNRMYLYTPGKVRRFTQGQGFTDPNPVPVSVVDGAGNPVNFVDPSPILDANGTIVLCFLNSTGFMGDPAGCNPYPCTKYFDTATEIPGSDGTQFILDNGHRYEINLQSGTASDPDLFEGPNGFYLYISRGASTAAFYSNSLQGSYTPLGLPNDILTNEGGIPAGIYNQGTSNYHSFVHSNVSGSIVIKSKSHAGFSQSIQNLNTVISGTLIGLSSNDKTESPGVCANQLSTGSNQLQDKPSELTIRTQRDFQTHKIYWVLESKKGNIGKWQLFDLSGKLIKTGNENIINSEKMSPGIYLIRVQEEEGHETTGKIIYYE